MFYSYALTVPANTARVSPHTAEVSLGHGTIHRVEVQFPAGCAGLVHAQIRYRERQIFPTNPDEDLSADGYVIAWDDDYDFISPPFHVLLVAWNTDDTYPHKITFRFGVRSFPPERRRLFPRLFRR